MARQSRIHARAVIALATFAAALAACNLLAGLTEDYSVGSGDGAAGGGDGSDDAAGNSEGGPDGGNDGTSPTDAPADAPKDMNVPDGRFCDLYGDGGNAVYCWDFEDPAAGQFFGWEDGEKISGDAGVENGIGVGGSKGFHAVITNPTVSGKAYIRQTAGGVFTDFHTHVLSFAFSLKTQSSLTTATLGALGYANMGVVSNGVSVYSPGNAIDVSNPPSNLGGQSIAAAVDSWHTARITMSRPGTTGAYNTTFEVTDDGGSFVTVYTGSFTGVAGATQVLVGAFYTSPGTGSVSAVIDNVLLKQIP